MTPTQQVEAAKKKTRETFDYSAKIMTELATRLAKELEASRVKVLFYEKNFPQIKCFFRKTTKRN
jgi:hypothetical protein